MSKHSHVLTLVFSVVSLISSLFVGKDLFTILGWFTAVMTSITALIYFVMLENNKQD